MGIILSSKIKKDNIVFELLMDYQEALQLRGQIENIHLFSDNVSHLKTNISTRGKKGSTKYLLIPKELRFNINFNQKINCQKLELSDKVIFIYTLEKLTL